MIKIVFLTTQLPYPPTSGGVIKSFKLVEYLSRETELTLVSLLKNDDNRNIQEFENRVTLKKGHYFNCQKERNTINLLTSYLTSKTLNEYRNYCAQIKENIVNLCKQADVIIIDHYEMYQYISSAHTSKKILHQHNAEYVLWERMAAIEPNILKKTLLKLESNRIKKKEKQYCQLSDLVLAAPNDIKKLKAITDNKGCFKSTYHLGDDALLNKRDIEFSTTKKQILYVGTLSWEANINGLIWFLKKCWPIIISKQPEITFKIAGKNPDNRITERVNNLKNVQLTGFIKDLEPLFQESRICIAPLKFGSGIKVKVLNALYRGIPMVTTSIGVEGIEGLTENHISIADDSHLFATECLNLLSNKKHWNALQKNSRSLAKEKYTWKFWLNKHLAEINELVSKNNN